jgi:putative spermidine/putrescine transport system permease protein
MLQMVEEAPNPAIAAVSTGLILLAVLVMILADRMVGLKKLAEF